MGGDVHWKEFTVEREGKRPLKGLMSVGRRMVTVSVGLRRKTAMFGASAPIVVARRLLLELERGRHELYD